MRTFKDRTSKTWKMITVTIYNDDLARLDEEVVRMKRRGGPGANRSAVLREAIRMLCDARDFERAMAEYEPALEAGGE